MANPSSRRPQPQARIVRGSFETESAEQKNAENKRIQRRQTTYRREANRGAAEVQLKDPLGTQHRLASRSQRWPHV